MTESKAKEIMQTSLHSQLITLNLKMDSGLQAIDQLSQLLILLVTELQGSPTDSERSSALPLLNSPLPEVLLHQLSTIRQGLLEFEQNLAVVQADFKPPMDALPQEGQGTVPQEVQDHQLVGDHEIVNAHTLVSDHEFASLHHKDVLEDDDSFGLEDTLNSALPTDMQVRRLMAQLTAAYNRIAALEEQLLFSHRPSYASHE